MRRPDGTCAGSIGSPTSRRPKGSIHQVADVA